LYRFSFLFAKNKDQKSLDLESAIAMWEVLFSPIANYHEKIRRFLQFLQGKRPVKVINKDQWMSVLDFVQTVEQDLSNYDISSAWYVPFLLSSL
ncbi:potentiating neddylation domain-containing protein, partial [Paraphysoderma sedebokerense]